MSAFHDHPDEMSRTGALDDPGIEALLIDGFGPDHPELAMFVADVRSLTDGPVPEPSAALSSLFARDLSTRNGDLSATAASNVPGPAPQVAGLPKWRRLTMIIQQFIAGLTVAGKLSLGATVAAAATTGAGTAGILPDAAQRTFDQVAPFREAPATGVVPTTVPEVAAGLPTSSSTTAAVPPSTTAPAAPVGAPNGADGTTEAPAGGRAVPVPAAPPTTAAPASPSGAPDPGPGSGDPSTGAEPAAPPTTAPPAVPALSCAQNPAWTGVNCRWSSAGSEVEYHLLIEGPGGTVDERIWGTAPTSYVDVHADQVGVTYRYTLQLRSGSTVLATSSSVSVTIVAV